ncbi:MAG TPA: phage baseplate assembly protein V [Kofleriaceae bacterium]|nr:phage baseplate assembly protein V [Kofleriaceae bacterium]
MKAVHDLPRLRVKIGSDPLDARRARALRRVRVVQALSAPAQCELVFQVPDEQLAEAGLAPGTAISIELEDHATALFVGEVTAVEHVYTAARWLEVRIRAYDPLHRLQKRQTPRAMTGVDAAAVAKVVVASAGIDAHVEPGGASVVWPSLLQHDQTDFELLREVCERTGLYFVLRQGTLHLLTLEGVRGGEAPELLLGESLLEVAFELNAAPSCRRVVARGWDPVRALPLEAQAEAPRSGRVAEARMVLADVGGADERLVGGLAGAGTAHAQLIAQAELDRAVASELTLRGTAQGDPDLRPGTAARVAGVADHLAGTYVLTEVVHTIDPETGYLAAISTRPPPPPARSGAMGMALGTVSAVNDPEGFGRVRVRLPAFGGIETGWLQVLGVGAGAQKGLSVLPDTDDQVLISLIGGDLSQAIVLGGLYGDANPDPGVEDGNVRRFSLQTAGGQRLVFDDQRRTLRISDAQGSHFEIGPERVSLHSKVPLTIEAPGNSLVFRASTIDFERR